KTIGGLRAFRRRRLGIIHQLLVRKSLTMDATTTAIQTVERLKDLYGDIAQIPIALNGRLHHNAASRFLQAICIWSNRALEMKKIHKSQRLSVLLERDDDRRIYELISTTSMPFISFETLAIAYSKSDSKIATLITITKEKEKKQYIKIYDLSEHIEICCVDVTTPKKHGVIHAESEFGGLKWSNGEGHILFTAEKYMKKTEYFDADLDWDNEEKIIESNVGEKFRLMENWGEQRNEICRPMLCIMDVMSGSVTVLDQIPDDLSPAYVSCIVSLDAICSLFSGVNVKEIEFPGEMTIASESDREDFIEDRKFLL
uniref:Acylamino-acid-releasing enzyme n=1 Tax=Parascaris univalens TaxID=6257 RepID=A0A915BLE0_PARUN